MGMGPESSQVDFLRALAGRQGIEPSDDDIEAVRGFLDRILPELERLEELLTAEDAP
jgi:hypothetical protein